MRQSKLSSDNSWTRWILYEIYSFSTFYALLKPIVSSYDVANRIVQTFNKWQQNV